MRYQKGFSFLEITLSLLFVTTIILGLLHLQLHASTFFLQIEHDIFVSNTSDNVGEKLFVDDAPNMFHTPSPWLPKEG